MAVTSPRKCRLSMKKGSDAMPKITLKAARVNAGLTQQEVANELDVALSTVRNWENGTTMPKLPYFVKLCQLYNMPMDSIFFEN